MRPIRLIMQAFGPYKNKEEIDFEKLSKNQLFLIKGPTGSGKTTIFDAIIFSLYGGSSGEQGNAKVGRNEFEQWRCNQAEADVDTIISFEFAVREVKYRFTRKLIRKRKNLSKVLEAGYFDENEKYVVFFDNPKDADLNKKAEELIGLTKEQFRQVVLLPQGQFERFLLAPSAEKEEILKKIFNAGQWEGYASKFYDAAAEKMQQLQDKKNKIQVSLSEDGFDDINKLDEAIREISEKIKIAEQEHIEFDGENKQKKLNNDIVLAEKFNTFHQLESVKYRLENRFEEICKKEKRLSDAEKVEALREFIKAKDDAKTELKKREEAYQAAKAQIEPAEAKRKQAQNDLDKHKADSIVEQYQNQIAILKSKKDFYQNIDTIRQKVQDTYRGWKSAVEKREKADAVYQNCVEEGRNAYVKYEKAQSDAAANRKKYYAEIYGIAAESLIEGEKCPVCGSLHHPEPAKTSTDGIGKEELEKSEKNVQTALNAWNKAREAQEKQLNIKNTAQQAENEANSYYRTANMEYEQYQKNLVKGIENSKELEEQIAFLDTAIHKYNDTREKLEKAIKYSEEILTRARTRLSAADDEWKATEKKAKESEECLYREIKMRGYENELEVRDYLLSVEQAKLLRDEISQYQADVRNNLENLHEKSQELSGKHEPDFLLFEERQNKISEETKNYTRTISNLSELQKRYVKKSAELKKECEKYEAQIVQAESDMAFAKKLRGDSGIGLQRYVLGIMFGQVIGEANQMLEKIHNGRYHLFRSDSKGVGNKRGLELRVYDSRSSDAEGRSVSMLSGGERFLVSLALSIGMSAVAQKSGVQIEALFIDEGFGTLDENSIDDAMEVLKSVQKNDSLIGIISHVKILEANIPTHLEVIKTEAGSSLRLN